MSAFVVEDRTINSIVSWLGCEITRNHWLWDKLIEYLGKNDTTVPNISIATWEKDLAIQMFQLNIAGVEVRYGKGETEANRDLNFRYMPVLPPTDVQALKSMNCWLYQCMEGNIPEHPLYKFFDDIVVRYLLEKIVYNSPEYDNATWG